MRPIRMLQVCFAAAVFSAALVALPAEAAATQTFTGRVSDTICGAKHKEGIPPSGLRSHLCETRCQIRLGSG
jgi:hypothetical protein